MILLRQEFFFELWKGLNKLKSTRYFVDLALIKYFLKMIIGTCIGKFLLCAILFLYLTGTECRYSMFLW